MAPLPLESDRLVGDRYILEAPVGKGGMGEVWRARHVALQSRVAIKFLEGASAQSERSRRRFLTEAQVTANLKTRHAVQVFDFGVTEDGRPYLVMELLEGETLDRRIAREGRLRAGATSQIMRQAARALERAHALGIVHRDFKPENIILVADEEDGGEHVKVVDFGIAKLVGDLDDTLKGALSQMAQARCAPGAPPELASSAVGTPYYMAPEQIADSAQVGPAADVWAFGVVAYECLTGHRAFEDDSVASLLRRILEGELPPPASRRAPVPAAFDDWLAVACARDPADRFHDVPTAASALSIALDQAVVAGPRALAGPTQPEAARPVSPLAATLGSIGAPAPPCPDPAPGSVATEPVLQTPIPVDLPPVAASVAAPSNHSRVPPRRRALAAFGGTIMIVAALLSMRSARPRNTALAATSSALAESPRSVASIDPPPPPTEIVPPLDTSATQLAISSSSPPIALPQRAPTRKARSSARPTPSAFRLPPLGI